MQMQNNQESADNPNMSGVFEYDDMDFGLKEVQSMVSHRLSNISDIQPISPVKEHDQQDQSMDGIEEVEEQKYQTQGSPQKSQLSNVSFTSSHLVSEPVENRLTNFYKEKKEARELERRQKLFEMKEDFKPHIDVNSQRMLGDREGKIEDRLYEIHQKKLEEEEVKS